jgi:hypothetical protein
MDFHEEECARAFFHEKKPSPLYREVYKINNLLTGVSDSSFKRFFKNLRIDTPEVLNKTPSLRRFKGLTPLKRLTLHLSRSGKKAKFSKLIMLSFYKIIDELKQLNLDNKSLIT